MSVNRLVFFGAPEIFPQPNQHLADDEEASGEVASMDELDTGVQLKKMKVIHSPTRFASRKAKYVLMVYNCMYMRTLNRCATEID